MSTDREKALREQLRKALDGDQSHITFEAAIVDFPLKLAGKKPASAPHSAWQLLEHLRIAQQDILEFSRNPQHVSPKWPDEYWPKDASPRDQKAWDESLTAYRKDAKEMAALIADPTQDLHTPIAGGDGQTLLREALVLAAHNSYHLGQLMYLRKMLENA